MQMTIPSPLDESDVVVAYAEASGIVVLARARLCSFAYAVSRRISASISDKDLWRLIPPLGWYCREVARK